jgi:hypothetical protein
MPNMKYFIFLFEQTVRNHQEFLIKKTPILLEVSFQFSPLFVPYTK